MKLVVLSLSLSLLSAAPQDINEIPMYGHVQKTKEQIAADTEFIAYMTKSGLSRRDAAMKAARRGWDYINANDLTTAMRRMNQAWLLDSNVAEIHWGFGTILGRQGAPMLDVVVMMKRALSLDSTNGRLWSDVGYTYTNQGSGVRDSAESALWYLGAEEAFARSSKLDPTYGYQFIQWTIL
jgi:Flp pilus assembly protein TadD